jgi:hypothetical protein
MSQKLLTPPNCSRCGLLKKKRTEGGWFCKPCKIAQDKRKQTAYPTRYRKRKIKAALRYHGFEPTLWVEAMLRQQGRCAICKRALATVCIDHDHATGKFRGLLCNQCNLGLGAFADSAGRLRQAADYVETSTISHSGHV